MGEQVSLHSFQFKVWWWWRIWFFREKRILCFLLFAQSALLFFCAYLFLPLYCSTSCCWRTFASAFLAFWSLSLRLTAPSFSSSSQNRLMQSLFLNKWSTKAVLENTLPHCGQALMFAACCSSDCCWAWDSCCSSCCCSWITLIPPFHDPTNLDTSKYLNFFHILRI